MKKSLASVLLVVLLAAVAAQGYYLYRLDNRLETLHGRAADVTAPDFELPDVPPTAQAGQPYSELQRMQHRMNRLFNDVFAQFDPHLPGHDLNADPGIAPSLDLEDVGDRYRLKIDLPGAEEAAIDVTVEGDRVLSIEATNKKGRIMRDQDSGRILKRERFIGRFQRELTLPEAVDPDSLESDYEDGVLTLNVKKKSAIG
jgi:HSP20 family protein